MGNQLALRIVVERPTAGVDIGLQKGRGSDYESVQTQRSKKEDLSFEFNVEVNEGKDGLPNFLGLFAQGPPRTGSSTWTLGHMLGKQAHHGAGA